MGSFDNISHDALLCQLPVFHKLIRKWLKAGVVEFGQRSKSHTGTPQGGIISPLLANIALDGLERLFGAEDKTGKPRKPSLRIGLNRGLSVTRYADDFVVVAPSQEVLEDYVLPKIQAFFKQRGLELNQAKTHIKHIDEGFDFLGFEIRRFGGKLLTKPAKDKVLSHLRRIRDFLRINRQAPTEFIIMKLNPIIRGWANYYRHSASKQTFNKVDHEVWKKLWRWARRRHRNKPAKWVKQRYFRDDGYWTFYANGMQLVRHDATPITRFRKVAGRSSPFDPSLRAYWDRRHRSHLAKHIHQRDRLSLLNQQAGNCGFCHQALELDWLDNHHIISRLQGGSNRLDNRMLVHKWCHHAHHQRLRYKAKKA